MSKIKIFLVQLFLFLFLAPACADENRTHLPKIIRNAYIGLELGYMGVNNPNILLAPGFTVRQIKSNAASYHVNLGYYYARYLDFELNGYWMYPKIRLLNIGNTTQFDGVPVTALGAFLKPKWPVSQRFTLFGLLGGGFVSHGGVWFRTSQIIKTQVTPTAFVGGGLTIAMSRAWGIDFSGTYGFGRSSERLPSFINFGMGAHFNFGKLDPSIVAPDNYYFPLNRIAAGYSNYNLMHVYVNRYFTAPYVPIFWRAPIKAKNGFIFSYERNFFHTQKYISLDWGLSGASWTSQVFSNQFYTAAAFLDFDFWFLRTKYCDVYFTYSIAGPAFISRTRLENREMGGNFIFQDALGLGALIGKTKHLNVTVKIGHYSNGSLLPDNPGIDIPLVLSLGYAFG